MSRLQVVLNHSAVPSREGARVNSLLGRKEALIKMPRQEKKDVKKDEKERKRNEKKKKRKTTSEQR